MQHNEKFAIFDTFFLAATEEKTISKNDEKISFFTGRVLYLISSPPFPFEVIFVAKRVSSGTGFRR